MRSTIAAYGMQRLLCAKDRQVDKWEAKYAKAQESFDKADSLLSEALRREVNLEKDLERL